MKRIIFLSGIICITIFATVIISCNKVKTTIEPAISNSIHNNTRGSDESITFNGIDYQIVDGMLTFSTFEQYEHLFDITDPNTLQDFALQTEESTAMTSYNEVQDDEERKLNFIGSIVNEQGLIKIDVFTLLLNFDDQTIYATRQGTSQDLINAKNGNISTSVYKLSMEGQETIDALTEIKTRGLLCKESFAKSKSDNNFDNPLITNINNIQEVAEAKYKQYGIYYSLMTFYEKKKPYNFYNGLYPHYHAVTTGWWQRRCSNVSGTTNETLNSAEGYGGLNANTSWYANARALKHFNVTITLFSNNSVPAGATKVININD